LIYGGTILSEDKKDDTNQEQNTPESKDDADSGVENQPEQAPDQSEPEQPEQPEQSAESPETPESETPEESEPEPEPVEPKSEAKETKKKDKPKKSKSKPGSDDAEPKKDGAKSPPEGSEENPDFKYIVRIANTNIDGNFTIAQGLTAIKGIGIRLATVIADKLELKRSNKVGDLSDDEVERISNAVENLKDDVPSWMLNRQKDIDTGENLHIISAEIALMFRDDLNRLKKIRCYRGIRHEQGQKVRGQRTRANGRSGMTVGVQRKRVQQQAQKKK
jgi:small subunit ribosomal protein S13